VKYLNRKTRVIDYMEQNAPSYKDVRGTEGNFRIVASEGYGFTVLGISIYRKYRKLIFDCAGCR